MATESQRIGAEDDIDIMFNEEELSNGPVMFIETIQKRTVFWLILIIAAILITSVVLGLTAPIVYQTSTTSTRECPNSQPMTPYSSSCLGVDVASNHTEWCGEIRNLTLLHRELSIRLIAAFDPATPTFVKDLRVNVRLWGMAGFSNGTWSSIVQAVSANHQIEFKCQSGEDYCRNVTLVYVPVLKYNNYRVCFSFDAKAHETAWMGDVLVSFNYVNSAFSMFELWFRFAFVVLSLISLTNFLFRQWRSGFPLSKWLTEQKWIIVIVIALILYNNPLFALRFITAGALGDVLEAFFSSTFICILLAFFFASFSSLQRDERQYQGIRRRKIDSELIFKFILVFCIWVITIVQWSWQELKYLADPAAHPTLDTTYETIRMIFYVLCIMYFIWALFTVLWSFTKIKTQQLRIRRNLIFGITIIVVALVAIGLALNYFDSIQKGVEFTSFMGIYNMYVVLLSILLSSDRVSASTQGHEDREHDVPLNAHVISGDFEDEDVDEDDV